MPTCNIDAKGKAVRLLWGALSLAVAIGMGALILLDILEGWGWWVGAGVAAALGLLSLWEGRRGWCVVRAMGIKTPI